MHIDNEVKLTIDKLAFGGEGVGFIQIDDKKLAVFVEETVPGDVIIARIGAKKRNFARGYVKKLLKPSPLRFKPRCRHFGSNFAEKNRFARNGLKPFQAKPGLKKACGGCFWQFLGIADQLKFKEQHVRDALQRIGGIQKASVLPIIGGEPWFYRNKMEFSFSRNTDGMLSLGLHIRRKHHDVVELTECFLLEPFVGDLVKKVRQFFCNFFGASSKANVQNEPALKSFTVRVGKNSGQIMMTLTAENGQPDFLPQFQEEILTYCKEKNLQLASLYFIHILNQKGRTKSFNEKLLWGKPTIEEYLNLPDIISNPINKTSQHDGRKRQCEKARTGDGCEPKLVLFKNPPPKKLCFEIAPSAFFQPNTRQAEKLYGKALEAAALTGKEVVFDLYCGTGTISLFCATIGKKVYGIELNADAIKNARENAALNGINNVDFFSGDVQKILPSLPQKPDVIIVDPPRNGLFPRVIEIIAALKPKRLVYISCNPAALARDAKLLIQRGFKLQTTQPIDMFPQTYHIEAVALFMSAS